MTTIWTVAVLVGLAPAMQIDHRGSSETETRRVPAVVKPTVVATYIPVANPFLFKLLMKLEKPKQDQIRLNKVRWGNNQPSTLTYEQLERAIGP